MLVDQVEIRNQAGIRSNRFGEEVIGVIESEPRWLRFLSNSVGTGSYRIVTGSTEFDTFDIIKTQSPDLLLLASSLDGLNTRGLVARIREFSPMPIIVVGEPADEDVLEEWYLGVGADLYLIKEKSLGKKELLARVGALLRRSSIHQGTQVQPIFTNGDFTIDSQQHLVQIGERVINATRIEYRLLHTFASNVGRILTSEYLLSQAWGEEYEHEEHMLYVNISRLRKKLGEDYQHPHFIHTSHGIGHRMPDFNHPKAGQVAGNPGSR